MAHPEKDKEKSEKELNDSLSEILKDHTRLFGTRLRELPHSELGESSGLNIRLYYPAIQSGKATTHELAERLCQLLPRFCLPNSEVSRVQREFAGTDDYLEMMAGLTNKARNLFQRANETTNRGGEAGELVLFLLTEWILEAPQILAKMSLKTNSEMPIHGADGVHAKFCETRKSLTFYLGESKLYSDIGRAISEAAKSISDAFSAKKLNREIELVRSNINLSGLSPLARDAFIRYLDPFEEEYNLRNDVATCLIGFDFEAYRNITKDKESESIFQTAASEEISRIRKMVAPAFKRANVKVEVEMFLLPLPSTQEFRKEFQDFIGWKPGNAGNF